MVKSIYVDLVHQSPAVQRAIDEAYIRGKRDGRDDSRTRFIQLLEKKIKEVEDDE